MISVIIPAYNEEKIIARTIRYLQNHGAASMEIIVVDGVSEDATIEESVRAGAVVVRSQRRGRSVQMNEGAKVARGSVFYFVHADSLPPSTFSRDILNTVSAGFESGCYRLRFDLPHWFLDINAWFTRFDLNAFRFGDQSLFVTREAFVKSGGFCEVHRLMEDQEIIRRLKKQGRFLVMKKSILTSARRYVTNGVYKTQGVFYLIWFLYQLGMTQDRLMMMLEKLKKA